jgi:hypothetical protein
MPTNTAAWLGAKQATLDVKPAPYTSPRANEIVVKMSLIALFGSQALLILMAKSDERLTKACEWLS